MPIGEVLTRVRSSGAVSADDVLVVRRAVYGGEIAVTPDEMETMLAIDEAASRADPSWTQLLQEAGADFIVNQMPPASWRSCVQLGSARLAASSMASIVSISSGVTAISPP